MDNVTIRPLAHKDIKDFYGSLLSNKSRGFAVDVDGDLAGIAGVMFAQGANIAFCDIKEQFINMKVLIYKTGLVLVYYIKQLGCYPLYAVASPRYKSSADFLERMGFVYHTSSDWMKIYKLNENPLEA